MNVGWSWTVFVMTMDRCLGLSHEKERKEAENVTDDVKCITIGVLIHFLVPIPQIGISRSPCTSIDLIMILNFLGYGILHRNTSKRLIP